MNDFQRMRRERYRQHHMRGRHRHGGDKRWFGLFILIAGVLLMLQKLDLFNFTFHNIWPYFLIGLGLIIGIKSRFQRHAWWILIAIGVVNIIPAFTIFGVSSIKLLLPAGLIMLGLAIILNSPKKKRWNECRDNIKTVTNNDNMLNVDVTFGGHKEIVTSKNFKGGNISATFGGAEINMMNADTPDNNINLNLKVTFAGVELVVPSHWEIKNEIGNTMGSVEDNRQVYTPTDAAEDRKVLYLTGNCSFGSIEIKSY